MKLRPVKRAFLALPWLVLGLALSFATYGDGLAVWNSSCNLSGCHLGTPSGARANGANSGDPGLLRQVINLGMGGFTTAALTTPQVNDVAAYIESQIHTSPKVGSATWPNPVTVDVSADVVLSWTYSHLSVLETASPPSSGSVAYDTATRMITFNPAAAGSFTFTYHARNSAGSISTSDRTVNITINKASQALTFSVLGGKTYGNAPFTVSATASSGLAASFSSSTTSVCTVSGTTVTLVGAGGCTILANQAGDINYNAAPQVPQGFTVSPASQAITFGPLADRTLAQSPFTLSATASSGLPVSFSSQTPPFCTVSGSTVSLLATGLCKIAANQAGNGNYNAAPQVTQSFNVSASVPAAPSGVIATPGNGIATVSFTPGATGGSPITSFNVMCNPGGFGANGAGSPISVTGLTNGVLYACSVTATNSIGTSTASSPANVTPNGGPFAYVGDISVVRVIDIVTEKLVGSIGGTGGLFRNVTVSPDARRAYAVDTNNSVVDVISTSANQVVSTIPVGSNPSGIAVTPNNQRVYVSNFGAGTISIIDIASLTVIATIPVGDGPVGVAVTPDSGTAFVTNANSNTVSVIDAATHAVVDTIAVDFSPQEIAVHPNGNKVYVANVDSSTISVIEHGTVTSSIPIDSGVGPIAFKLDGSLAYVGGFSTLTVLDATTNAMVTTVDMPSNQVTGLAMTPDDTELYVMSSSGVVAVVHTGTYAISANITGFNGPASFSGGFIMPTVPATPVMGSASGGNAQSTVSFSPPFTNGGSRITSYTAIASPGGASSSASASPITVTGLTNGTSYTFTVVATNLVGNSTASASSNSVTPGPNVPGPPTIGLATAGNAQATIAFSAPASNGGSPITSYTVTSIPGGLAASGAASPIVIGGLTNGLAYTFTVAATNAVGTGAASSPSNSVMPSAAILAYTVSSSQVHGSAGLPDATYAVPISLGVPLTGSVSTDPRAASARTLIFSFSSAVTNAGTLSTVDKDGIAVSGTASASGNLVTVSFAGADNKRYAVTLSNVNGGGGSASATIGFLVGDLDGDRATTQAEVDAVKSLSGQLTSDVNFRSDVNRDGKITASDILVTKGRLGFVIP